jgi:tetratricopeptide (TPR) repeat protein
MEDHSESFARINEMIDAERWHEAWIIVEDIERTRELSNIEKVQKGILAFKNNMPDLGICTFNHSDLTDYRNCALLRRALVAPLIKSKNYSQAAQVVKIILESHPNSVLDLTTLASIEVRQGNRAEAALHFTQALSLQKNNLNLVSQIIQLHLQANEAEKAAHLAMEYQSEWQQETRLLQMSLLAMSRVNRQSECLQIIKAIDFHQKHTEVCVLSAQIAYDCNDYPLVQKIIQIFENKEPFDIKALLLKAKTLIATGEDIEEILEQLESASKNAEENLQVNLFLSEQLLKKGRFVDAANYLKKCRNLSKNNPHIHLLNARALKFSGRYNEAADEMLELVELKPSSSSIKRYATAALIQAGRDEEAKALFDADVESRKAALPETFEKGMLLLSEKINEVKIPQSRLDWLWQILQTHSPDDLPNRAVYELSAKWGHLLDHFILEWLECCPMQADEVMQLLPNLDDVETRIKQVLANENGLIIASAHIGMLYAGPMILELLGIENKWLASTPSISSMAYSKNLISTSENTEAQVVRKVLKALNLGEAVTIAVDGAMSPAAPTIGFEGKKVTFSDFAARMSHRTSAPSFFAVPFWLNNQLELVFKELPTPNNGEAIEIFCQRWREAFLQFLRDFILEHPENARLSGGIWRGV